jgi:hypothetical protein
VRQLPSTIIKFDLDLTTFNEVVPNMKLPHERYNDLWERALANCVHIEQFRWRSAIPIPLSIIQDLSSKSRLRILSLPSGRISSEIDGNELFRIQPLEELVLHSPLKHFGPRCFEWITGMSDSLRLLDLEVTTKLNLNNLIDQVGSMLER